MGRLGNIRVISGGLGCNVTFFQTEELKTEIYPEFPEGRRNAQLMKSEDSTVQQVYSQVWRLQSKLNFGWLDS